MAQKQHPSEHPELFSLFSQVPAEFGELGKKQIEAFSNAQMEFLSNLQEINKHWMDRMQSEANIASEFVFEVDRSALNSRRYDRLPGMD